MSVSSNILLVILALLSACMTSLSFLKSEKKFLEGQLRSFIKWVLIAVFFLSISMTMMYLGELFPDLKDTFITSNYIVLVSTILSFTRASLFLTDMADEYGFADVADRVAVAMGQKAKK